MRLPTPTDDQHLNLAWLLRLRWGAMFGQILCVVAVDAFMSVPVDHPAAALLVAAVGLSNLALGYRYRDARAVPAWLPGAVLVADVLMFTGLLAVSGGASNPFSFLYVLYIAVAALMLRGAHPWLVAGVAIAGYGSLYFGRMGLTDHAGAHTDVHRHLYGMWVAMAVTGAMIAYFVDMIRQELERRGERLREMQEARSRRERLAALATMAAGAAHELSTPISTIAVVANELHRIGEEHDDAAVTREAGVIREEADRCREILDKMAADSGRRRDSTFETVCPIEVAEEARCRADAPARVEVTGECSEEPRIRVPIDAFADNLSAVIDNGLRASPDGDPVAVTVREEADRIDFRVEDRGVGMDEETRRHAVEPFFTTREPGEGMGLGLFLTRELVEGLGGDLAIDSEEDTGTTVRLTIPTPSTPVTNGSADE